MKIATKKFTCFKQLGSWWVFYRISSGEGAILLKRCDAFDTARWFVWNEIAKTVRLR